MTPGLEVRASPVGQRKVDMGTLSREPRPFATPSTPKLPFIVTVAPGLLGKLTPRACRLFITLLRRADAPAPEVEVPPARATSEVKSVDPKHAVIAGNVGRDAIEPSTGNASTPEEATQQRRREMDQRFAAIEAARQMELDIAAADPKLLRAMRNGEISLTAAHARIAART
jgi:hypothetical protein